MLRCSYFSARRDSRPVAFCGGMRIKGETKREKRRTGGMVALQPWSFLKASTNPPVFLRILLCSIIDSAGTFEPFQKRLL